MAIEKPLPMQIGDTYYYTLTSYDPVDIEVEVPYVSDADVDFTMKSLVERAGGSMDNLDDAWIAEKFEGAKSSDDMRNQLRAELEQTNAIYAEQSKAQKCVDALVSRLGQSVPAPVVASYRSLLAAQFEADLAHDNMTRDDLYAQTGTSGDYFERMFDEQAAHMAEEFAALDAYINQKKLKVADEEIAGLLQLPPDEAKRIVEEAASEGATEQLRQSALRNKTIRSLVAECSCTYKHETPEEAAKRAEEYERIAKAEAVRKSFEVEEGGAGKTDAPAPDDADDSSAPDLKLV